MERFYFEKRQKMIFISNRITQGRRMNTKDNNAGKGNQMLLTNTEEQKHKHNDTQIQKHKNTRALGDTQTQRGT